MIVVDREAPVLPGLVALRDVTTGAVRYLPRDLVEGAGPGPAWRLSPDLPGGSP